MGTGLDDDDANAMALLAHAHWTQHSAGKAALLYAALDLLRPHQAHVLLGLAAAELAQGAAQQALAALDRLLPPGRPDAAHHLLRAQALAKLGRRQEAERAMRAFIDTRHGQEPPA